jgi:hypothetical protein
MRSPSAAARERARFGPLRTLNLRSSMPTGDESAARVESWLRSKQVELSGEVLVITGRGTGSIGGVPVVKERTMRVLNRLRRLGVIQGFAEDTPGSFIVMLAPLRSLLEAPARRKTSTPAATRRGPNISGLKTQTRDRLSYLAERSLNALGVRSPSAAQVSEEMQRQFSIIARSAAPNADADWWLEHAISRALREYGDSDR